MLYLLALIAPPLAVLMAGKFWHAVLNFIMCCTIVLIPVAMVHAWLMVRESYGYRSGETIVVNTHQYNQTTPYTTRDEGLRAPPLQGKPKMVSRRTRRTTDWKDW